MNNHLISIILPCYRAERFLSHIIEDVVAQTYKGWELLIVSNGDAQAAQLAIAKSYAAKHPNIKVLTSEKGGVSFARNLGMREAQGKWLTFIDADDRISADHLQRYMTAVADAEEEPDIVVGGFILDQTGGREKAPCNVSIPTGYGKRELIEQCDEVIVGAIWNRLFRTYLARQASFGSEYTMYEDSIFNVTLLEKTDRVLCIPMTGYRYVMQDAGSAVSRYHATLEAAVADFNTRLHRLYQQVGMTAEETHQCQVADSWLQRYTLVRNLFKSGTPLSFGEQRRAVRRIAFGDPLLREAARQHHYKTESLLLKAWLFCLRSRSPLLTTLAFRLQYWLKGHFMPLFLRLWPLIAHKK